MSNRVIATLLTGLVLAIGIFHVKIKEIPEEEDIHRISHYIWNQENWEGKVAPDFDLTLLDGKIFKLSDEVGKKVVVLTFFTTACSECRLDTTELNRLHEKYKSDQFMILGISVDQKEERVKEGNS